MDYGDVVDEVEDHDSSLVLCNESNFREAADRITAGLLEKGYEGVFFTVDRSFQEVEDELDYLDADTGNLYFLDAVSAERGIGTEREDVTLVNSPDAYNDINVAFTELLDGLGKKSFVILDSFTSYLLYGDVEDVGNFVHRISKRVRDSDSKFVVTAVENQLDEEDIEKCSKACGHRIDLS